MPNASIVNAPPSVVITPKIDTPAIKSEDDISDKKQKTSLLRFLEYLLKVLQKKDSNNFFAMPVNDQFAPGYSQIIKTPMDFSTMRSKVILIRFQPIASCLVYFSFKIVNIWHKNIFLYF